MTVQASINIDLDTLSDEIDEHARMIRSTELRAITYRKVLPRFLDLLDRHDVKATFFVIGRDVPENAAVLKSIAAAGHELANHTMNHPKQLVRLSPPAVAKEIADCGRCIQAATGVAPVGFRAPGYTISSEVIAALRAAGYKYDTSLNGSLVYLVLKRLFRLIRLTDKEFIIAQPFADAFGPRNPYRISERPSVADPNGTFIEIPISVVPYLNYPFITSVLLQLGPAFSLWCLRRLVAAGRFVNCNLHINEFTDRGDIAGVEGTFYFTEQYAEIALADRMRYFDAVVAEMKARCEIVLLRDVAA